MQERHDMQILWPCIAVPPHPVRPVHPCEPLSQPHSAAYRHRRPLRRNLPPPMPPVCWWP